MDDGMIPFSQAEARLIARTCTCFHLRKAARSVTQFYDQVLQPSGLRITQFCVLVSLSLRGPQSVTDLASCLGMDRTTLTRSLQVLAQQGLLRVEEGSDRRRHLVRLTDQGSAALLLAYPYWQHAQTSLVAQLGDDRWSALLADLTHVVTTTQPS